MSYVATEITGIGDPFVYYEDGCYYMYATSSGDGIYVWKGGEPNRLEKSGLCYKKENSFGDGNFWAPEVIKRADGKYIMHFTARCRKCKGQRIGVALSDSPEGPFTDVFDGSPMFDFGYAAIDASCLADDDGKFYLYYVRDCWDNVIDGVHTSQIYAAELDETLTRFVSEPLLIATPEGEWETHEYPAACVNDVDDVIQRGERYRFLWNEGPSVIKREGRYYLTYSVNCFDSKYYAVGAAVADKPLGPFVKYGEPALSFIEGQLSGPGHNSFFTDKNGTLMSAFHCHSVYDRRNGDRRFCYCPVVFCDGKLKFLYK